MRPSLFWDVTQNWLILRYRSFGKNLSIPNWRVKQSMKKFLPALCSLDYKFQHLHSAQIYCIRGHKTAEKSSKFAFVLILNKVATKTKTILRKTWIKEDGVMKRIEPTRHANLSLNKYVRMQTCENELHKKVHCSVWIGSHQQSLHTVASTQHCSFARSESKNSEHELTKLHKYTS